MLISLLPPSQSPTAPCPVREAAEGAARASGCGRDGGDVCVHGVCPPLQPVGGRGRWAPRGGCGGQDSLPSLKEEEELVS